MRTPRSAPAAGSGFFLPLLLLLPLALAGCAADASPPEDAEDARPPVIPAQSRPDVRGVEAAVSAGHPLAAAVGYDVLRAGGTATDAVVAMAAVLAVVRPHMNGVGGDAFALFYEAETGEVHALEGSGRAGELGTPEFFLEQELEEIPSRGAASVSVPGAVAAWFDALERFGTRPASELLAPAIRYAREGFPVSRRLHLDIDEASGALEDAAQEVYLVDGNAPAVGSLLRNAALARTLERAAEEGKDGFYRGPVAESIARVVEEEGGYLRARDLVDHTSAWREPLRLDHLGHRIHVMPPSTQGVAQLQQLAMQEALELGALEHNSADYLHALAEIRKLAFADRDRWVADPEFVEVPVERLLDPDYLRERAALVDMTRAVEDPGSGIRAVASREGSSGEVHLARTATSGGAHQGEPQPGGGDRDGSGDTVYITAVDQWGNAVSWIQSIYLSFGSGLMDPETGVLLHNRGALFSLDPDHPNVIEPGKRPYHTLTPLLATRDGGRLGFTLGTPGGDGQTQILLQVMNNVLHFGMDPQEAIEAPRIRGQSGVRVSVEDRIPSAVLRELQTRGHELDVVGDWTATFGNAQMIWVEPESGTLTVGADARREGYALAY